MVNALRTIRGASPVGSVTDAVMLDERGRELYIEFVRRMDLIRFGQYGKAWAFKDPSAVNNPDKELFPIPSNAILTNSKLVQNPGY